MAKIKVAIPIVELGGDRDGPHHVELYQEQAILPYLEVDLRYYDLGMERRDALTSVRQDRP